MQHSETRVFGCHPEIKQPLVWGSLTTNSDSTDITRYFKSRRENPLSFCQHNISNKFPYRLRIHIRENLHLGYVNIHSTHHEHWLLSRSGVHCISRSFGVSFQNPLLEHCLCVAEDRHFVCKSVHMHTRKIEGFCE